MNSNFNINYIDEEHMDIEKNINCVCSECLPKKKRVCEKNPTCKCDNCEFPVGLVGLEMGLKKYHGSKGLTVYSQRLAAKIVKIEN